MDNSLEQKLEGFLKRNFDLVGRREGFRSGKIHTLEIELTKLCNLSCFYCYAESDTSSDLGKSLSVEKAKEILDNAKEYGIRQINWMGGEPLVNRNWIEIVRYSKSLGIRNEVWSNGVALHDKNISNIVELCDSFAIHVDSINPASYYHTQQPRTEEGLHRVLEGFDRLLQKGFDPKKNKAQYHLDKKRFA